MRVWRVAGVGCLRDVEPEIPRERQLLGGHLPQVPIIFTQRLKASVSAKSMFST